MFLLNTLSISRYTSRTIFFIIFLALCHSTTVFADVNKSIENALKLGQKDGKYGQVKFNLRYFFENANTRNSTVKTANADTIRLRIGYLTPKFHSFQAFAEYEVNQDVFNNNYNSIRNRKDTYDVIPDPQQHELNQFWFTFSGLADTEVKVGRQRIKIDNDRFIGNVGWRQMEQTYDAVLVTNQTFKNATIKAGYIINARDILSRENDMDSQFVNIGHDIENIGKLSGYTYLIDYHEARRQNASSSQTYGIRLNGGHKLNDNFKALYTAEYAWQKDLADNPFSYEVSYYNIMGGLSAYGVTLKATMEQLGGQNGIGFNTPLSTLHAFQGWADVFLRTPADGIRDTNVSVSTKVMGVKMMGIYHDFDDDIGSTDYGQELDFLVVKKFGKHYTLLAKYAYYNAENFGVDTQKFWFFGEINF